MKTIKIITDLKTKETLEVVLKKTFEYKGETFAIVKNEYNSLGLYHFRSGGKMPSYFNHKKTIKDFHLKSLEALETTFNRSEGAFFEILNKQETLNDKLD
jgi:hypothetical protein